MLRDGPNGELLRVVRPHGGSAREPLFTVADIERWRCWTMWSSAGPNARVGDGAMRVLFAQLQAP